MSPHDIELIYELSPMQQAMLFHSLYAPGSGVYVLQTSLRLTGRLDVSALERAWRHVVARHCILRSAFFWENLETPRQVVFREVDLEVTRQCWCGLDPAGRQARLAAFLESDRARGFELSEAPLMRLALFELGPDVHQLVWTQHHLVVDGWSQGQVLQELLAAYAAFSESSEPRLEPARSFREYIVWLQRQDLGQAEAFWRERLAGFTAPTFLASGDGQAEGRGGQEPRRQDLALPAETSARLREVARQGRLTLNTLVQGAWALLLAQATGRRDVVFGGTVAGRPADLPGVESIVGPFLNTLPVRVEVRPERRLHDWLAGLQERQVEMRRFEHAPLVDVQKWSELPAGVPLFDHILVFENLALPAELSRPLPGLEIVEEAASSLTNYPLSLIVIPGSELLLSLRYDSGRFETPEAVRMLERLAGLLSAFASGQDLPLGELPLLCPAERHQALVEWNDTARPYETGACLPELIARQAGRTPEAVAASFEGEDLTWRELESRAGELARHLTRLGVVPEHRVGVRMERSLELIVALLGTMKAGAAYVPLDPSWPEERLNTLIESAGISVVLGEALTPGPSPASGRGGNVPRIEPENLAYVLFTSGSTGTPKGVMIPHQGIVNRLLWMQEAYGLTPEDRVLQKTPFSFDVSVWEFFWPLLAGARLVFAKPEGHKDPAYLAGLIAREKITTLHFVPPMLQAFLETPGLESLRSLRRVVASGEALPPDLVRRFFARLPWVELHNLYGPTEASVDVSFWPCIPEPVRVPIGRPIANLRLHVVDREIRPLPIGVPGELLLGGVGLARGYLGRPELTAAAFVPDPFGAEPGGRLYRTGDLTRYLPDGNVEYLGRIDHQVKIRGFRIELGEIEAVLASHPEVRECVVLARRDLPGRGGDARLVGYVVRHRTDLSDPTDRTDYPTDRSDRSDRFDAPHLAAWLHEKLPDYMVPAAFVFLDTFPLTTSGKVDRKALPAPERPAADAVGHAAPSGPAEELLAGIWAEVLGLERVGVHDNFFALGGHSLLATRVVSRIRGAFGVELPLRRLFEAPTVAELARVVRESRAGEEAPPVAPVPREGDLPLSFAQQRLWLLDQIEPDGAAYNVPLAVRLRGEVSPALLERVLGEVVRRHEALRTTFDARSGEPVQVIAAPCVPALPVVDLSGLSDRSDLQARAIAREEALCPFDLRRGPLLRVRLVRLAEREWILLLTMHHIVSDGWSLGVLLREIAVLSEAFSQERPSPLPELPVQYADYAVWQRGWLQGDVLLGEIDFWRRQLAGAPRLLELPTDRPRPAVQTFRGATRPVALAPDLAPALAALCREEAVTPFMALLAAWALLLGRHAGQDDVMVGSPVAGRNRREIEELIGCFLNLLAFRLELGGAGATFSDLLRRTREVALDAYAHQGLPFERLVEEVVHERDLAISPLFQVLFSLQNVPAAPVRLRGLELAPVAMESEVAKFDLSLYVSQGAEGIGGSLEFNTALFDGTTAERLAERFARLVAGAVADPACRLGDLPLLAPAEREQLLAGWNSTAEPFPEDLCVHELVAAQVARTPEAPAVSSAGERWSYRELWDEAGRLAGRLAALGVGPEVLVAVRMERSPRMLAALLGVLRAGGAYVPLDPAHPQERLAHILEDAKARVVVTDEGALTPGPSPASGRGEKNSSPENLAYVIYTSGSTGRPKGVGVPHRAVANYLATMARRPGMAAGDVVVAVTTVSFDIAVTELLLPLTVGARIELVGRETAGDAVRLAAVLESAGATFFQATPATWTLLVEGGWAGRPDLKALCGGEALPRALADRLLPRVGELWNVYGPTETTVWSAAHRIVPEAGAVPVGLPLGNTTIHLAGRWGELVPPGAAGELLIGGAGLARGYHGRPDLTAERFVPNPFVDPTDRSDRTDQSDRLYRTGDLARRRPDGTLEVLGRIDFQVKIRGFRIEPGEIEAALADHPEVRECVAGVYDAPSGDRQLVAWLVLHPKSKIQNPKSLFSDHLRQRLPDYMVPSAFVPLDAFPLTPSGKVDRKALPAPDRSRRDGGREIVPPRTRTEAALVEMWKEVLGLDALGIEDGFFELGGHSLLATRVLARVRRSFGVEIPLLDLFRHPTVAGLAGRIEEKAELPAGGAELTTLLDELDLLSDDEVLRADPRSFLARLARLAPPPPATEAAAPPSPVSLPRPEDPGEAATFPTSFAQQRLWFLDRLQPGNPVYNIPLPVRVRGELPPARLERIFAEVVRRHEALRTTFAGGEDGPVQVIHPPRPPALPVVDLSGLPDRADRQAREIALAEAQRSFDLEAGPLLRFTLVRLAAEDHVLLMTLHHVVSDGWSMGVLLREVAALWNAFSQGRPSPLPALPIQYADFAVWQRRWLRGRDLEEQLAFWKSRLAGAPAVLELPTDRPRPPLQTYRGASAARRLAPSVSAALRELCQRQDATPFMALLAVWAVLLARHSGQEDVPVGTPVAGRHRKETVDLIGFFVNTLVVRAELAGAPDFRAVLERVRRASLDAFIHQDLPFERIVEELVAERDPSHSPLFQVMFALQQNAPRPDVRMPGLTLSPVAVETRTAKLDLTLTAADVPDGFAVELEHNTDLFDGSTAERLLARFEVLLEAAASDPGRPLADLPLLPAAERHQVLVEWNAPAAVAAPGASLGELIEAAARRVPDAPAVVGADGEVWSYRRLDAASNRLARRLRALGVGLDEAVGLCMERSPELILGVVAVLKAGGVYLPLNPEHPDERLQFQIEDTGARVVLVHARTRGRLEGRRRLEVDAATFEVGEDASSPGLRVPRECLSYIIYTSGSTGVPKGVGVPHGAAADHAAVIAEDDGLGPGERVVQFSSLSFDVSIEQMLPTLISGAAVVLRDEDLASPAEMLSGFARLGITSANLPTAYWHQAVQTWSADAVPPPLRLRVQCVGGEAMQPEAARRWMVLAGPLGLAGVRLINGYGPTETVVTATRHTVPGTIPAGASSVPIGRILPGRAGYVVDPDGALQPVGVPGELCLGGILARGYVNRPDLTAERFVPDPWSGEPGARMYRTGDLARSLPDGSLDYLGRIDRQVKVRGFRIEPGEIEAALAAHPGVRDCAVVARRDTPAGDRLVAYVVAGRAGAGLSVAALREWLKKTLPDYMVPAAVVFLEALPLTANGKVDRKALPAPGRTAAAGEEPVAVRDELELRLVRIFEELLGVWPVGLRDSFFALGGHSLLAVRLVGAIERQLGCKVPLAALLAAPTVEQMARLVREEVSLPRSPLVPIDTSGTRPPLFLVHPVGGNVFCYLPLVRGGGLEGPVYGLQAPGADALADPWTIEAMAARYVAALREVEPAGPYRLAGWSLGGVVAWEMARQLAEQGSEVDLLALIDPGTPQPVPEPPDPRRELAQFLFDLAGLAGIDPSVRRELPAEATLEDLLAREEIRALLPPDVGVEQLRELFALFRANVRALGSWAPRPYGGRLTLIRAAASAAAQPEAAEAWSALARGGAEVHVLPGDHYSLLRAPHAAALSDLLAACCRRLDGGPASSAERRAALSPAKRDLLAALLREKSAGAAAILPRGTSGPAPLSFAQERMWFLHLLDPQSPAYNVHLGARLEGALQPAALAAGLAGLRRRHQVLATRYELAGGQPVQVIEAEAPFELPAIDLSGLPAERRGGAFARLQSEEGGRPFDLRRGPVMRAVLVRLAAEEHALFLTIHHVATDGWSGGILMQDLAALYAALVEGRPSGLPAPRLQYADFAVWQRRRLQGEALEEQLAYWRRQLEPPLPVLQLPTDRPRTAPQAFQAGTAELVLPADLTADLRALANACGATLFMILLAGLTAVLQRSGGDDRILVGAPVAGRTQVEIEELVGFFLNNLVLAVDLDGDPGFAGLVDNAARTALGAFAHQDLPLETLLQRLRLERGPRGPFQAMLLLQNLPRTDLRVPGLTLSPLATGWQVDLGTDIFEIGLTVWEHGPALHAEMTGNALLFETPTIQRLLRQLGVLLRGAVADPGTPLSVLPLLSPEDELEILAWDPPEGRAYVVDRSLALVPVGVRGELLRGEPDLAPCPGRPELAAERFVPDPFSGVAGARLYRTGTLMRRRADGSLEDAGNIERQPLPAAGGVLPEPERPDVAPRNEVEEIIAEIWCEALGLERLSVFDSFFELGGHSLLLLQVMQRLRDVFEVEIPLRSIYEERTVAALAIKVEELALQELARG